MSGDDALERPLHWGPGGQPKDGELVDSWSPGRSNDSTWGAYHRVLFPPRQVTPWIRFKTMSTVASIAQRLWNERESLRMKYEAVHGEDAEAWPARHPGIVLESVQWIAHGACLGCRWLDRSGTPMKDEGWRIAAARVALKHQGSRGDEQR
ncbi:hypothetical protein [Mycolicibacterium sp. P1-18]|uniref:hypothetical protein n=1 Tax=Mycolicibacterium sp. P1-18 TaxID=2024615 RepID=UPI0018D72250|nr:hypothetical protein [Mycolicibacterium sp. P1-18]